MRYGIFSDIHANLEALEAVIQFYETQNIDQYICLGDIVGNGPNPQECLNRVLDLNSIIVAGNYDYAVSGKGKTSYFGAYATQVLLRTRAQLLTKHLDFLSSLDLLKIVYEKMTLVHGTLIFPELFDYIQTQEDANRNLSVLDTPVCFYGHSHVPFTFKKDEFTLLRDNEIIDVVPEAKILINVGSVGRPRDGNPLACCCIYDDISGKAWVYRIEYDIDKTVKKIIDLDSHEILAMPLYCGR